MTGRDRRLRGRGRVRRDPGCPADPHGLPGHGRLRRRRVAVVCRDRARAEGGRRGGDGRRDLDADRLDNAEDTALAVAKNNGYPERGRDHGHRVEGRRPSQLRVTISIRRQQLRLGTRDRRRPDHRAGRGRLHGAGPDGQPVQHLRQRAGQHQPRPAPARGQRVAHASVRQLQLDPALLGGDRRAQTDKMHGDRYMTTARHCVRHVRVHVRTEHREALRGYFWAIHVEPAAVGQSIEVQIYDPAYIETGTTCGDLSGLTTTASTSTRRTPPVGTPARATRSVPATTATERRTPPRRPTPRSSSGADRHGRPHEGCGDLGVHEAVPRSPEDPDPLGAAGPPPTAALSQWSNPPLNTTTRARYNPELTRVFHQWVSLCTFTAQRAGDYFLQVRTNVSPRRDRDTQHERRRRQLRPDGLLRQDHRRQPRRRHDPGFGLNAFALRALPTNTAVPRQTSRSPATRGCRSTRTPPAAPPPSTWFAHCQGPGAVHRLRLLRCGGRHRAGTVKVVPPADATLDGKSGTNITGCRSAINSGPHTTCQRPARRASAPAPTTARSTT